MGEQCLGRVRESRPENRRERQTDPLYSSENTWKLAGNCPDTREYGTLKTGLHG